MKLLILGGSGMLGHQLWRSFASRFDTHVTFRRSVESFNKFGFFDRARATANVSAHDFDSITKVVADVRPDVIINCIGIIKQDAAAKDPYQSLTINALFPHRLSQLAKASGARLVHISTDCVFDGKRGHYRDEDLTNAEDLYGRTKALGEVSGAHCLTIRTSIIGRELDGSHSLVDWFLKQNGGSIRGFKRAVFSGFTTMALARIIEDVLTLHPELNGMWQVSADPINKYDLLLMVGRAFGMQIEILPDEIFHCDRSLDSSRFRAATGIVPPSWPAMIQELAADKNSYNSPAS